MILKMLMKFTKTTDEIAMKNTDNFIKEKEPLREKNIFHRHS